MNKSEHIALIITALALSSCGANQYSNNELQDSSHAVKYFSNELNFTITPMSVKRAITSPDEKVNIVDVRSQHDYMAGHIPGAINLPHDKWNTFEGNESEFPGLIRDGYNIVYCYQDLCNLSQKAALKFASLGYPVKEMRGGYKSWKDYKLAIQK